MTASTRSVLSHPPASCPLPPPLSSLTFLASHPCRPLLSLRDTFSLSLQSSASQRYYFSHPSIISNGFSYFVYLWLDLCKFIQYFLGFQCYLKFVCFSFQFCVFLWNGYVWLIFMLADCHNYDNHLWFLVDFAIV